ncbi:MAG: prepilin-type N-terminal cleavage/methylation domain-containing protein [Archangium sp.]|nr:prepilin-type N-terminal cleavage/methylation domain-containing protein [Archangium sp.]
MRRSRGFTIIELAIVLSISAVLVPLCFMFVRALTTRSDLATFDLEVASTLRSVHEQLELDRTRPACAVKWTLEAGALTRTASAECGGTLVLARDVKSLERIAGGASVVLVKRLAPEHEVTREIFVAGVVP